MSAQTLALIHTSYQFYSSEHWHLWTSVPSLAKGRCPAWARHNPWHGWGAVPRGKKKAKCSKICSFLGSNSVSSLSLGCWYNCCHCRLISLPWSRFNRAESTPTPAYTASAGAARLPLGFRYWSTPAAHTDTGECWPCPMPAHLPLATKGFVLFQSTKAPWLCATNFPRLGCTTSV